MPMSRIPPFFRENYSKAPCKTEVQISSLLKLKVKATHTKTALIDSAIRIVCLSSHKIFRSKQLRKIKSPRRKAGILHETEEGGRRSHDLLPASAVYLRFCFARAVYGGGRRFAYASDAVYRISSLKYLHTIVSGAPLHAWFFVPRIKKSSQIVEFSFTMSG